MLLWSRKIFCFFQVGYMYSQIETFCFQTVRKSESTNTPGCQPANEDSSFDFGIEKARKAKDFTSKIWTFRIKSNRQVTYSLKLFVYWCFHCSCRNGGSKNCFAYPWSTIKQKQNHSHESAHALRDQARNDK